MDAAKEALLSLNLSDVVVEYIKEKILLGEYKAGDRILERAIATDIGISRAPVREGIRELQIGGLLEFVPRKGNYIAMISETDLKEIVDVYLLLKYNIVEMIISDKSLNKRDFYFLKTIVDEMLCITCSTKELKFKIFEFYKKDMEFHNYIWSKSKSKRRVRILKDLFIQLQLATLVYVSEIDYLENLIEKHFDIIKAFEIDNVEFCNNCFRKYIMAFVSLSSKVKFL